MGSIFSKRHWWEKKEVIDAERLFEICSDIESGDAQKAYVENITVYQQLEVKDKVFMYVDLEQIVPPGCMLRKDLSLSVLYDANENKAYMVSDDCGTISETIDGTLYEFRSSAFHGIPKTIIAGKIELVNLYHG